MEMLSGLFANMVDFSCGEYSDSSDKCDELGPIQVPVEEKQEPIEKKRTNSKYTSFMFALIDLLQSMN